MSAIIVLSLLLQMLEARHMIVRNKLMVPMPASTNNSGWSTTSIVHLPRYAPKVVLGAEAVFKEVKTAQGQQLQQQAVQQEQQGQGSGNYIVRDDATVMQQVGVTVDAICCACPSIRHHSPGCQHCHGYLHMNCAKHVTQLLGVLNLPM